MTLQCGLTAESLNYYCASSETLRAIGDSLWLGAATEGVCASSSIILYPHLRHSVNFQRNISLQGGTLSSTPQKNLHRASDGSRQILQHRKFDMKISLDKSQKPYNDSSSSSSSESSNTMTLSNPSSENSLGSSNDSDAKPTVDPKQQNPSMPSNILQPDEITTRYREAIINYSKYR